MARTKHEADLEARAQLFKALGHPVRLLILNLVQSQPRHGEELAAILGLKAATISHHLSKLAEVGLLSSFKDQYYQMYRLEKSLLQKSLADVVDLPQPNLEAKVEEDAYRAKVLKTFFKHGRLAQIPTQLKKRIVILEKLVEEFEPGRQYAEMEVNQILLDFNEDVATLRREMVNHHLLKRTNHGIYWRPDKAA